MVKIKVHFRNTKNVYFFIRSCRDSKIKYVKLTFEMQIFLINFGAVKEYIQSSHFKISKPITNLLFFNNNIFLN